MIFNCTLHSWLISVKSIYLHYKNHKTYKAVLHINYHLIPSVHITEVGYLQAQPETKVQCRQWSLLAAFNFGGRGKRISDLDQPGLQKVPGHPGLHRKNLSQKGSSKDRLSYVSQSSFNKMVLTHQRHTISARSHIQFWSTTEGYSDSRSAGRSNGTSKVQN